MTIKEIQVSRFVCEDGTIHETETAAIQHNTLASIFAIFGTYAAYGKIELSDIAEIFRKHHTQISALLQNLK